MEEDDLVINNSDNSIIFWKFYWDVKYHFKWWDNFWAIIFCKKDRWHKQFENNSGHDTLHVALARKFHGKGNDRKTISG